MGRSPGDPCDPEKLRVLLVSTGSALATRDQFTRDIIRRAIPPASESYGREGWHSVPHTRLPAIRIRAHDCAWDDVRNGSRRSRANARATRRWLRRESGRVTAWRWRLNRVAAANPTRWTVYAATEPNTRRLAIIRYPASRVDPRHGSSAEWSPARRDAGGSGAPDNRGTYVLAVGSSRDLSDIQPLRRSLDRVTLPDALFASPLPVLIRATASRDEGRPATAATSRDSNPRARRPERFRDINTFRVISD